MSDTTPQPFPLFATLAGEEYLVVGWTSYNVPRLVPLDKPTGAQSKVPPKTDTTVTYALNQKELR